MKYVALLRGINVGGNNLIKMTDLKAHFLKMGFTGVVTYIQSGNVIFESTNKATKKLVQKIEAELSKKFDYHSRVVLVLDRELKNAINLAPKGFGSQILKYRYDVIFLRPPLTATQAFKSINTKPGVDRVWLGRGVMYFSRLTAKASQSRLSKIVSSPIYKDITIRNWNTTTKLLGLIDTRSKNKLKF